MSVGGFFDAAVDFASDFVGDFAGDLALDTFVDGFGTEFLTDIGSSVIDIGGDLFTAGGEFFGDIGGSLYDTVGSFAGDATWFNATSFGDILSGPVTGFSEIFSGVTDFLPNPSNFVANAVNSVTAAIPQVATGVARSTISNATGLPPNLIPGFGGSGISLPSLGSIFTGPTGINPAIVPGIGSAISTPGFAGLISGPSSVNPNLVGYNTTGFQLPSLSNLLGLPASVPGGVTPTQILPTALAPREQALPRPVEFAEIYNPETGLFDVYNLTTNEVVSSGLTQQEAIIAAQDLSITENITLEPTARPVGYTVQFNEAFGSWEVVDSNGGVVAENLTEQEAILQAQELSVIDGGDTPQNFNPINPTILANNEDTVRAQSLIDQARRQQTIRDQRQNKAQSSDWRVRLRLAPSSNYLYNDPQCGPVLWPLRNTDGVIFPYTPNIDTAYKANYSQYDLTHSNYRGYFYQGSYVDAVNIRAQFTAQDTSEANYLLAVITFFKSATKMFYGQDAQRGAPPPLVYLSGLGDYQFNEHPCAISQFNYTLPSDVDYIRAQTSLNVGTNLLVRRDRQNIAGNPLSYALQRLTTALPGLAPGALPNSNRPPANTLGIDNPTYVPTKMEISLTLLPIQSRQQVSKQFSVKNFANGNLLKGGFW